MRRPITNGTCTICHDTPNAGNHSVPMALNIGVADASRRTADLPLYTLRRRATGETVQTTDPGRAMVTGKWDDIGKFKGPVLRALGRAAAVLPRRVRRDAGRRDQVLRHAVPGPIH